jgi:hypothetical protein
MDENQDKSRNQTGNLTERVIATKFYERNERHSIADATNKLNNEMAVAFNAVGKSANLRPIT